MIQSTNQQKETLETEIKKFADELPYWGKYIADKILSGDDISESHIENAYTYLLEELKLMPKTEKTDISVNAKSKEPANYINDLQFKKLLNVEGVNALIENQTIELTPHLTIIYGANGSGKSGYVRLLKDAFYSKVPEKILPNVHSEDTNKSIKADFIFNSEDKEYKLEYPAAKNNSEFKQFAVFDGKSVIKHLQEKNEFEFRPAGLSFFSAFTETIKKIEKKLNTDIDKKKSGYTKDDLIELFEGESEIKTFIENINPDTTTDELNKYTPFREEDKEKKNKIEKEYDELNIAYKNKEKEIKKLKNIERLIDENKKLVEKLNKSFSNEALNKVKNAINDCINKDKIAKEEGIENFKTDKIQGIGTTEWKNFIKAAEEFAKNQKENKVSYPQKDDNCIFCQQPLSPQAHNLIKNYWSFIHSAAEDNAKDANENLDKILNYYKNLDFHLFPQDNTLTVWLTEKYPEILKKLNTNLSELKELAALIVSDINSKSFNEHNSKEIDIEPFDKIKKEITESVKSLENSDLSKNLNDILKEKRELEHKEKYNKHFSKFKTYIDNQKWIKKAKKANFKKRKITETEKELSNKYFNQNYIDIFNDECEALNGNFGIEISHTGTEGKSYRQLMLKGINPNSVLSEGEQKVIAIADFLSEMQLTNINKGIIFDDPVNSLDDARKNEIAERLVNESLSKQVVIFTHDLVFVSSLISSSEEQNVKVDCHWIETFDERPGKIWLRNSPTYEKYYKKSGKAQEYYKQAKEASPDKRQDLLKNGFGALRTSYESLVIFDLFKGVVQRFNERVSIDSLSDVIVSKEIRDEIIDGFHKCSRYMEGHSHSDKYSYKKPDLASLREEIQRFDGIKKKIKDFQKDK